MIGMKNGAGIGVKTPCESEGKSIDEGKSRGC